MNRRLLPRAQAAMRARLARERDIQKLRRYAIRGYIQSHPCGICADRGNNPYRSCAHREPAILEAVADNATRGLR